MLIWRFKFFYWNWNERWSCHDICVINFTHYLQDYTTWMEGACLFIQAENIVSVQNVLSWSQLGACYKVTVPTARTKNMHKELIFGSRPFVFQVLAGLRQQMWNVLLTLLKYFFCMVMFYIVAINLNVKIPNRAK